MSNFTRRYLEVTLAVVILLTLTSGRVFGAEQPVKPLVDFMFTPSNSIYADYGFSDETFQFFNFVRLKEICQIHEAQIAALRAEIDELKKLVAELKDIIGALENKAIVDGDGVSIFTSEGILMLGRNGTIRKDDGSTRYVRKENGTVCFIDPNEVAK